MIVSRLVALLAGALLASLARAASAPLVVHEWGTFTSYQDEQGRTIAGINVDDEPVPDFVHRIKDMLIFPAHSLPARWSQGAPRCYPDVTLRLETPVVYFYPPAHGMVPAFDVRAAFVGGWLTEFYPAAEVSGVEMGAAIGPTTRGTLSWNRLQLDPSASSWMPDSFQDVWLQPRKVDSAVLVNRESKEAEKYLFYRGVGHLDAPLIVRQGDGVLSIALRDGEQSLPRLPRLWLVEVSAQGRVRYQTLNAAGGNTSATAFAGAGDESSQLDALRAELKAALTAAGLFGKEADAMLDTWRLSYFESEGLRVFFLLPQGWTDAHLPLTISTPADITRVMVGRVELVSPRQRQGVRELQDLPDAAFPRLPLYYEDHSVLRTWGTSAWKLSDLYRSSGREVPESLQQYESLGRFRDALLAHELRVTDEADKRARLARVVDRYSACASPRMPSDVKNARLTTER